MTSDPNQVAVQRQAIAKLVADGVIKHDRPGIYPDATTPEEERVLIPAYDVVEFQQAFPDILQVDFEEALENGVSTGFVALIHDGRSEPQRVDIGKVLPTNTQGLVEVFRAYFKGIYNIEQLESARDVFEGIE